MINKKPNISQDIIFRWLKTKLMDHLSIEKHLIQADLSLFDAGISSVWIIKLVGELEEWLGIELDPDALFEYPTLGELSDLLFKLYTDEQE
jgi:acyl carrier protein